MFSNFNISSLSSEEASIYLRTVIAVATSDGQVDDRERDYIDEQAMQLDVEVDKQKKLWDHPDSDLEFLNNIEMARIKRLAIIRDCIIVGSLDGYFDIFERQEVNRIAEILKLDDSDVEEVEEWVKDNVSIEE